MTDQKTGPFELGDPMPELYAKYFTGPAWLKMLVMPGTAHNCPIGNVTFAPGTINFWHRHAGGQILLVTAGRGWYCEEGKPARELHAGDTVEIPADVKHWHGAAKDSTFVHLSVETNVAEGGVTWLEPVDPAEYAKLP